LPAALGERLGFLLGRVHQAHRRVVEARLAPLGLGPRDFGALCVLTEEGPLSQLRLGQRMGVDRTSMVAITDHLERTGLVRRERNPRDRRAYEMRVTAKGRRVLERATVATEQAEAEFLARLPAADRRRILVLLRTLASPRADW
jgi:DNA-binding MarR family transcriptional regulator